jgi:hypothetical protein
MVNSGTLEAERESRESGGLPGLLSGALERLTDALSVQHDDSERERRERNRINQNLYSIPDITIGQITAASGTGSILKVPEIAGPKTGQVWYVNRISYQGLTAGQVNIFYISELGTQADSLFFVASAALSRFYGSVQMPVRPGQFLVFQAGASWAGTTTISMSVTNVAAEYEGLYLL